MLHVMETEFSDKIVAAKEQLRNAMRLHREEEFISAITLAGAADELLGKALDFGKQNNQKNSLTQSIDFIHGNLSKRNESPGRAKIKDILNYPRNSLKHLKASGKTHLNFNKKEESSTLIERAVENLVLLEGWSEVPDEYITFDTEDKP